MTGNRVALIRGDITTVAVDVIVNAASRRMRGGGGVDGAIHAAGGSEILSDCISHFPLGLPTGAAGWTRAGRLPARWVIHVVGPNWTVGERDRGLLESCYANALALADHLAAASIAFPLISAGVYGWPLADAVDCAVEVLHRTPTQVEDIRLVAFNDEIEGLAQALLSGQSRSAT